MNTDFRYGLGCFPDKRICVHLRSSVANLLIVIENAIALPTCPRQSRRFPRVRPWNRRLPGLTSARTPGARCEESTHFFCKPDEHLHKVGRGKKAAAFR